MEFLIDLFLHLDKHLNEIITSYGTLTYLILFIVIFCETGLVFTPFLPGDSLLFAAGTFAALGSLNVHLLFLILASAAILGDTANYFIGKFLSGKILKMNSRFVKKEYLDKTHQFYEKYGGKTIIIARFVPIVRTFAPFVAGIGEMTYPKFIMYNVVGAILWCGLFLYGSYFFGNIPFVRNNFSIVVIMLIVIPVLPVIIEVARNMFRKKSAEAE